MTNANVIARPYAQAAFDYALEQQQLPAWQRALSGLAQCIEHPKMQWVLQSPRYTPEQVGERVLTLMNDLLEQPCQQFVQLLAENKRLEALTQISELFDALYRQHQQVLPVEVTTAIAFDKTDADKLIAALHKRFAQQLEVTYHVDATILGGVIVRAGDVVIDGSFASQLTRLTNTLMA